MKKGRNRKRDGKDQGLGLGPRSSWRLWSVRYRGRDRIGDGEPAGVLITTSGILPLPIAFISNVGRNAVKLALTIIRGSASFADVLDYRGRNWLGVGTCVNGALLYPLDSISGAFDPSIYHLDAAMVSIDPLDGGVSFMTFDRARLRTYLGTQAMLDRAIPRAIARQRSAEVSAA